MIVPWKCCFLVPRALILSTVLLTWCESVAAAESSPARLNVRFHCDGPPLEWCNSVTSDLLADLHHRGVEVRSGSTSEEETNDSDARIRLFLVEPSPLIGIEIDDRLTNKRLYRQFDPGSLPADSSAIAAAIAVEELLAASWAELSSRRTPLPVEESTSTQSESAPKQRGTSREVVDAAPRSGTTFAAQNHFDLGLQLASELGQGLGPLFGGEVFLGYSVARVRLALTGGYTRSFENEVRVGESAIGVLHAESIPVRASVQYFFVDQKLFAFAPSLAFESGLTRIVSAPRVGYRSQSLEGASLALLVGGLAEVRMGDFFLRCEGGGGRTIREFLPSADSQPTAGISGYYGFANFGGGLRF